MREFDAVIADVVRHLEVTRLSNACDYCKKGITSELIAERMKTCARCREGETRVVSGTKADAGKPRFELLSPEFLAGVSKVLAFGAAKYGDRNWEHGLSFARYFGAAMRHLWAWWGGEENDTESGLPHLAHAACCLMYLYHYQHGKTGSAEDDRPKIATRLTMPPMPPPWNGPTGAPAWTAPRVAHSFKGEG